MQGLVAACACVIVMAEKVLQQCHPSTQVTMILSGGATSVRIHDTPFFNLYVSRERIPFGMRHSIVEKLLQFISHHHLGHHLLLKQQASVKCQVLIAT